MVSEARLKRIGVLTGTTASGKTALALEWARRNARIEIVNADSLLVYRGMDIGTAKPTREELATIPHHLIDIREPEQAFNAGDFVRAAQVAFAEIEARGKRALVVGGTGFYLKALLYGLWKGSSTDPAFRATLDRHSPAELFELLRARDAESAQRIGPQDRYRLVRALEIIHGSGQTPTELERAMPAQADPRFVLWITDRASAALEARIRVRTEQMVRAGLVDEVERLLGQYPTARALSAVGYAQVIDYLQGKAPAGRKLKPGLEGLVDEITLATRQLVKRQRTWFRGQTDGQWFELPEQADALQTEFEKFYGP